MLQQLEFADTVRRQVAPRIAKRRKSELGQFMTPSSTARFMASLFPPSNLKSCRLLDAGAGVGALSCAFIDRWICGGFGFQDIQAYAYEIDDQLRRHLAEHLAAYMGVTAHISGEDFISSSNQVLFHKAVEYTHAILNPPYKKINSQSAHRHELRELGIETVNLYSAFVALAVLHAAQGGQIVAIIPRSFCNGPYYRPFRELILRKAALRHIHLFDSRTTAFKDDDVLQENVIIRLERGGIQGPVTISTSTDDNLSDLESHEYPFNQIVLPDDTEGFIHVPSARDEDVAAFETPASLHHSLADIGVNVSTGPVVDFRLKDYLRQMPGTGTVPLLYPGHFGINRTEWPIAGGKKPNAIERNNNTEKWLFPTGHYCVVRRFSSKEEKRRIVASTVDPDVFGTAQALGFENHLNVFHENRRGLSKELANGLAVFLNTTVVDKAFRRFNGHTQVNATDLKTMKYPSRSALIELGKWALKSGKLTQQMIDERLGALLA
ncbi:MAG: Eco57I restriction-modification methylase domain-containing protein [Acidobacteriota bacterium]|nr:Eco57I restriction-modification methylase domain-containing protein [Acidobacteriota bacterium]